MLDQLIRFMLFLLAVMIISTCNVMLESFLRNAVTTYLVSRLVIIFLRG